jgi:predicted Zn-dependent protease
MYVRIILLSLYLTSCSVCSRDIGLQSLATSLMKQSNISDSNVCSIKYGLLDEDTAGLAEILPMVQCDITISPFLSPNIEKSVMLHEIGHCVGLDHVDGYGHIMSKGAADELYIEQNWGRMVQGFKDQLRSHRGR